MPRAFLAFGGNVGDARATIRDIDILTYDDLTLDEPNLTLPHARLFERAFVLVPLSEIAPDAIVSGRSLSEALERLDRSGILRLG